MRAERADGCRPDGGRSRSSTAPTARSNGKSSTACWWWPSARTSRRASRQTVAARLQPGDYAITCGLLSNPRGRLHVTAEGTASGAGKTPDVRAFIGALSEYKVYLILESDAMVSAAEELAAAIHAGDLAKARTLYEAARLPYERIEPVAYRFADLANAINPVADYLAKREADPAFTGYHRIAYALFGGGDAHDLAAMADKLVADLKGLKARLVALRLTPPDLADSAARMAEQLADGRIVHGEDRYAGTDLADIDANLAGITKLVGLLRPIVSLAAPKAMDAVDAKLAAATKALDALRQGDAWPAYDTVSADQRKALSAAFQALATPLPASTAPSASPETCCRPIGEDCHDRHSPPIAATCSSAWAPLPAGHWPAQSVRPSQPPMARMPPMRPRPSPRPASASLSTARIRPASSRRARPAAWSPPSTRWCASRRTSKRSSDG